MTTADRTPTSQSDAATLTALTGRKLEIVDAAARLFEEHGYHRTTIDDIAGAVGIQKGTIYHHFDSKDEILLWIHDGFIEGVFELQRDRAERGGLTGREEIAEIIRDVIEVIDAKRSYVRVFFEFYRELPDDYKADIEAKRRAYRQLVRDAIQRGVDSGEFRVDDLDIATLGLFGMMNWAYQWYRPGHRLSARQVADRLWRLVIGGLTGG